MNYNASTSTNVCPSCKGTTFDAIKGRITEENNTITSYIPETYRSHLARGTLISVSIAFISVSLIAHPDTSANPLFHYVVFFAILTIGMICSLLWWRIYVKTKTFATVFVCKTCQLYICLSPNALWPKDVHEVRRFVPANIRSLEKFHRSMKSKNKKSNR